MDFRKIAEEYEKNGCCKIENFLTPAEVEDMRQGLNDVIQHMTDDMHVHSSHSNPRSKKEEEYFINSVDKVSYFFENDAFDSEGNLTVEDKTKALSRIAFALHWWNPNFKRISFSQKVKDLLQNFKYKDPVIVQGMLIFKHPKVGEIFRPHQDSTFLYTEPPTSIGLWFPIEDATIENGCLWFLPGSHKDRVHQRYVRIPENDLLMNMKGEIPPVDDTKYIPIPAKKGDCVLIHGSVLHKSARNNTDKPRVVYTFHAVEKEAEWSKENWAQPTERFSFPSIYSN